MRFTQSCYLVCPVSQGICQDVLYLENLLGKEWQQLHWGRYQQKGPYKLLAVDFWFDCQCVANKYLNPRHSEGKHSFSMGNSGRGAVIIVLGCAQEGVSSPLPLLFHSSRAFHPAHHAHTREGADAQTPTSRVAAVPRKAGVLKLFQAQRQNNCGHSSCPHCLWPHTGRGCVIERPPLDLAACCDQSPSRLDPTAGHLPGWYPYTDESARNLLVLVRCSSRQRGYLSLRLGPN